MSKRCKLQKEYYQANGNYKGVGKYNDDYVRWLEDQILALRIHSVSNSCDAEDTSILIKGLEDIANWDDEQEEWYDDPGHCANMTLIKYYNSKK